MTRLITRIGPLSSIMVLPRGRNGRRRMELTLLFPGADERLITSSELDQLNRTLSNRRD